MYCKGTSNLMLLQQTELRRWHSTQWTYVFHTVNICSTQAMSWHSNTVLHCVDLAFWYNFSVYIQLQLFTLLFIADVHSIFFGLIGRLQMYKLVLQGNCYCRGFFCRLVMCYIHAHVQFYSFIGQIFLLFRYMVVLDVFMCGNSSCLERPTCTPEDGQLGHMYLQ
jgi:hypothetical protein